MQKSQAQNLVIKSHQLENFQISGYASVFGDVDQHNDIIVKGAFSSIREQDSIKFLWQHDFSKPIGIIHLLKEDQYGLKIEGEINSNVRSGREAIELIKQGAIDGLSIGFNIKQAHYNNLGQKLITDIELIEVSIVTLPANRQAKINKLSNKNFNKIIALKKALNDFDETLSNYI